MDAWALVLAIAGGIITIGGAGAVIYKAIRPAFLINKRVSALEEKADKDYKVLQQITASNKIQNRLLMSIINHQIDGNGVERMKQIRDELSDLIFR